LTETPKSRNGVDGVKFVQVKVIDQKFKIIRGKMSLSAETESEIGKTRYATVYWAKIIGPSPIIFIPASWL